MQFLINFVVLNTFLFLKCAQHWTHNRASHPFPFYIFLPLKTSGIVDTSWQFSNSGAVMFAVC